MISQLKINNIEQYIRTFLPKSTIEKIQFWRRKILAKKNHKKTTKKRRVILPRTPARKGDNLNFNGAKFINNFNLKSLCQKRITLLKSR